MISVGKVRTKATPAKEIGRALYEMVLLMYEMMFGGRWAGANAVYLSNRVGLIYPGFTGIVGTHPGASELIIR